MTMASEISETSVKTILQTCDNWDTDYNSYNWEPEFITIFVTWQSRVTLDSMRNSCDVFIGPGVNISTSSSESHAKIFILVFVVQKFSSWCFLGKNIHFFTRFSLCLDSVHWKPHYSISSKCSDEYPVLSCTSSSIRHDALLYIQHQQPTFSDFESYAYIRVCIR